MFTNAKIIGSDVATADYLKQPGKLGENSFVMSSSALRTFAHCPDRWVHGYATKESDAKDFGSLFDCLLLTPSLLEKRYAIIPAKYPSKGMQCPKCLSVTDSAKCKKCKTDRIEIDIEKDWNWNSSACQEWGEAERAKGKELVHTFDLEQAQLAAKRIHGDPILNSFLECSDRQVCVTGEWQDDATGLLIPVKCLIDLVPRKDSEFSGCLADLKTTRTAAVLPWNRDCFNYGYHLQASWHLALYEAATQEARDTWCFILCENYPPFQFGRRMLSQDFLALGKAEVGRLMENYAACLKANRWPDYDATDEALQGGWSLVQPYPWMAEKAAFAPKFNFEDSQPEDSAHDPDDVVP